MTEETVNQLEDFVRRVQGLANCLEQDEKAGLVSLRVGSAAVQLSESAQTLRDLLAEEVL